MAAITTFCLKCWQNVTFHRKIVTEKFSVADVPMELTAERVICDNCGEQLYIGEISDKELSKMHKKL